ncbi:MAG: hypothetical protein CMF42_03390 [Legionellales bacterium]|nr:hypothetical protein [Legionellales bacterium]
MKLFFTFANLLVTMFFLFGCQSNQAIDFSNPQSFSQYTHKVMIDTALHQSLRYPEAIQYVNQAYSQKSQTLSERDKHGLHLAQAQNALQLGQYDQAWKLLLNIDPLKLDQSWSKPFHRLYWYTASNVNSCPRKTPSVQEQWTYLLNQKNHLSCKGITDFEAVNLKQLLNAPQSQWAATLLQWHDQHPMHWTESMIHWDQLHKEMTSPHHIAIFLPLSGQNEKIGQSIKQGMLAIAQKETEMSFFDTQVALSTTFAEESEKTDAIIAYLSDHEAQSIQFNEKPTLLLNATHVQQANIIQIPDHSVATDLVAFAKSHHHEHLIWVTDQQHRVNVALWPDSVTEHIALPLSQNLTQSNPPHQPDGIFMLSEDWNIIPQLMTTRQLTPVTIYTLPTTSRPPELSHLVTLSSHWSMQQVPTHWSPFYNQIIKITPIQDPYFAKGIDAYLITMYRHVLAQIGDTPIEMASGTYFPDQNTWQYQREPFHGDHGKWIQMVDFFD